MAFFKGSAYEAVPAFEPDRRGTVLFRGVRARRLRHPESVLEHMVANRERLDSVAQEYFAESRDWRWLVEANTDVLFPEDLLWTPEESAPDDPSAATGRERIGQMVVVPRRREVG